MSAGGVFASRRLLVSGQSALVVVVLGYVVRGPIGGLTWHHLQYVLGLQRLGHEVYFVEDSEDFPSCYDPETRQVSTDPVPGLRYAKEVFGRFGIGDRWAYYDAHAKRWDGPCASRIGAVCRRADVVLNVSGVNPLRGALMDVPVRALIDTDPLFTQVRHLSQPWARERALRHTCFFSFGENIGTAECRIPDDGLPWARTRQPVVMDLWRVEPVPDARHFTTILQWESYSALEYGGVRYGMKAETFEEYVDLPSHVTSPLELALVGSSEPHRDRLTACGWLLTDPVHVSKTPWTYADYVRRSKAEFSTAKEGYVLANTGWFSERSTCYLASGRPVVLQDTGFSTWLPTGEGVMSFHDLEEAAAAIRSVEGAYARHCRAAREVVTEFFSAEVVLEQLLARATSSEN